MEKKISYYAKDFNRIREELINFTKKNYPDNYNDFNDGSIGMMLIELHAAVGDMLTFNLDRVYQESNLNFAQERKSIFNIAKNFGLKIPSKRPSVALCDFTVNIPVKGDSFDIDYCPIIVRNANVSGAGQTFETVYDIDFSSPYSQSGIPNRTIVPKFDTNGIIQYYVISKRELIVNGQSKFFKKIITIDDSKPFLNIILPDNNILSVDNIIDLDGINYNRLPTLNEWFDTTKKWHEVDNLLENFVFTPNAQIDTDRNDVISGKWEKISKRFTTEFTDKGYCMVKFGNGYFDNSEQGNYISDPYSVIEDINKRINNLSMGAIPRLNTTLFIRYKVGGGVKTNVSANVINSISEIQMLTYGTDPQINSSVQSSLKVNNPIPAIGGSDELNIEEIRNLVSYNFASQNRAVILEDYYAIIQKIDGQFGKPQKLTLALNDNKISIIVVNVDADGSFNNINTDTIRENIAEYLSHFRMMNDYIEVVNGKVINLGLEVDLLVNRNSERTNIVRDAVEIIYDFFKIDNINLGQNIYTSDIIEGLNNISNVLNVVKLKVYNKVGGNYSLNRISRHSYDSNGLIDLGVSSSILSAYNEIFEVKNKNKDIKINLVYGV